MAVACKLLVAGGPSGVLQFDAVPAQGEFVDLPPTGPFSGHLFCRVDRVVHAPIGTELQSVTLFVSVAPRGS